MILDQKFENDIYQFDNSKDRRQKKTHKAVEGALLEILQEKDYELITISEVAERADVNRKTFYNNYNSLDEVMISIEEKMSALIFSRLPQKITVQNEIEIYNLLLDFAKVISPYKKVLRRITRHRGISVIFEDVQNAIQPYIEHSMMSYHIDAAIIPYAGKYITNGLTAMFYEWFMSDTLTDEQISKLSYNLIASTIKLDNFKEI